MSFEHAIFLCFFLMIRISNNETTKLTVMDKRSRFMKFDIISMKE